MDYLIAFLTVAAFLATGTAAYACWFGAPWLPSGSKERAGVVELADLHGTEVVCDLGSGDGTLLFQIARHHPRCRLIGVEIFILPHAISVIRKILGRQRYQNVHLLFRDLFKFDVSDADVVFVYQIPKCYDRLAKKFSRELKPDCRVIMEAWPFPDIEPLTMMKGEKSLSLYLYRGEQFGSGKLKAES